MTIKEKLNALHRSNRDQMIGGVCAGFAEATDTPAWLWRAGFVLTAVLLGGGAVVYLVLWLLMPLDGDASIDGSR